MMAQNVFVSILPFLLVSNSVGEVKHPVIIIPGTEGSQIEARLNKISTVHHFCAKTTNWFTLWLNERSLLPYFIDCFVDNMRLVYDPNTRTTKNSPGVETRIPGFGLTRTIESLDPFSPLFDDYFEDMVKMFRKRGYIEGLSLRGAPYDFRKGPNELGEYFGALKDLIQETYFANGNKPVVMIVHSMGALMAQTFLQRMTQEWRDKYVRTMISLAGVWGGTVQALRVFAVGDDLGLLPELGFALRPVQISCPSLAWLLPSSSLWEPDEILVESENKNYSLSNLKEFFDDLDYRNGWEMYVDVKPYFTDFDKPPQVEVHCLYGYGTPTVEKLRYPKGRKLSQSPNLVKGDGDGVVNRRSLESCAKWKDKQTQPVREYTFKNIQHMAIVEDRGALKQIEEILAQL